ncbi:MAG TPA: hypothetical protein VGG16_22495 [Streptosporangiaceae bacterium]
MAEEPVFNKPDVVLGLDAAWGFASADQTSPALAGAAGALVDTTTFRESVTELRIHGVSGSDGPTMLEHPQALQVAGDSVAGFYRRWSPDGPGRPSVPWKLEAYSWGGLTEAPLASASWLLMAPFMMYNLAYFMLPPTQAAIADGPGQHLHRDRGHAIAHVLLRLLAMAATIQFVTAVVTVAMSTVAWQAAGETNSLLPSWMGWYGRWTVGWRVALAMASVAAIIGAAWLISVKTASKYEGRISLSRPERRTGWPLTERGFWRGQALVGRQRALHTAAACASVALIAVLASAHSAATWPAVGLAVVALIAAVVMVMLPVADRYTVTLVAGGEPESGSGTWWCRGVLLVGLAALVTSALVTGLTGHQDGRQPGALPNLNRFLAVLLLVQAALLVLLAVTVMVLARRGRRDGLYGEVSSDAHAEGTGRPYLGANLTTLVATLGFSLGGLLSVVVIFGVTRLLGTSEPSGYRFGPAPSDALAVPWPEYAFVAAPVGLLCGVAVAAIVLIVRYNRRRGDFLNPAESGLSPVAEAYASSTAGVPGASGDGGEYNTNREAIAAAWAAGRIADDADTAVALAVGGSLLLVLAAEIVLAIYAGPAGHPRTLSVLWQGTASAVTLVVVLVAGGLVTLLRQAYSDPDKRKTIGALWDVGTFWPRAVHPLAPPCYAERAVPEVVDRIRLLTGDFTDQPDDVAYLKYQAGLADLERTEGLTVPPRRLLLTGYSQGSIIAPAVIAQLGPDVLPDLALLTLACPARRLYGRAFPAYFGQHQLIELARLLGADAPREDDMASRLNRALARARWRDLRRRSDYIGSWIFGEPESTMTPEYLHDQVDQACLDPVVLVQNMNPARPGIHRHSQWWQDPRTNELGHYLIEQLGGQPGAT